MEQTGGRVLCSSQGQRSLGDSCKKKGSGMHHFPPLPPSINKATCRISAALTPPNLLTLPPSPSSPACLCLSWYCRSPPPEDKQQLANTVCPASAHVVDPLPPIHSQPKHIPSSITSLAVYKHHSKEIAVPEAGKGNHTHL